MTQPRRRSRRLAWSVGAALLLLVALLAYLVWSGLGARTDLKAAEQDATQLQSALLDGDRDSADAALRSFATHTDSARGRTDGPIWAAAARVPLVGTNFEAVRLVSWSASEVGRQAHVALFGNEDRDLFTDIAPKDGRIDLDVVRELQPLMARLDRSLSTSTTKLRTIKTDNLSRFIKPSFARFRDKLFDARSIVSGANKAVQVLPDALGGEQPTTYLLRFLNNAEIRSTGGFPGAWALLRTSDGQLKLVEQGSASVFGEFPKPVVPLTKAEHEIWGVQAATYFGDTNFIPDMPRSAEITRVMWDEKFPDDPIDGVIEVDAVTLSYILRATGDVEVPDTGITLTSENTVEELLSNTYARLPDKAEQDEFFADAAKAVFESVSQGSGSAAQLLKALSQSVGEGRLRIHSFDEAVQSQLSGSAVAGEMHFGDGAPPELGIYLNDAAAAKMQYYLETDVDTKPVRCEAKQQVFTTTMTFRMPLVDVDTIPPYAQGSGRYGTEPGAQFIAVTIYGPVGGEFADLAFDGEVEDDLEVDTDRDRPVLSTAVFLETGTEVKVSWTTTTRPDHVGALQVTATPGFESRPAVVQITPACR